MKWILVLILFAGDEVLDFKLMAGEAKEKCERVRVDTVQKAKDAGVEVWGKCIELDRVKPPVIPPEKMNKDGYSEDGKRRGQNS